MKPYLTVLLASLTVFSTPVFAQHQGTPAQQRACRGDVLRHCRTVQAQGDYAMASCLQENMPRLSAGCRRVLERR
jgi:hypothetical protein